MHVPVPRHTRDHGPIFRRGRKFFARFVRHSEPAAQIGMGHGATGGAQFADQFANLAESGFERLQIAQLAADMNGNAAHIEPFFASERRVDFGCAVERHAKLVLALAGRDLLMRARIDIGIDPESAGRALAYPAGDGGKLVALFLALDIELADAFIEPLLQFRMRFADAGKHDVFRLHSRLQGARELAPGNHVGAIAFVGQHAQHGKVRIGFDGKGDMRLFQPGKRIAKHAGMAHECRARIDIDGGADLIGNHRQRYIFGVQDAVAELEMVHVRPHAASRRTSRDSLGSRATIWP